MRFIWEITTFRAHQKVKLQKKLTNITLKLKLHNALDHGAKPVTYIYEPVVKPCRNIMVISLSSYSLNTLRQQLSSPHKLEDIRNDIKT